jgi:multiple sugar transport system ATP-binding protein
MATVELKGVARKYGSVTAVSEVNLTVGDKEFVTLVGPSGCGKTTLLHMIAGLLEPTAGDVLIDGQVVNRVDPKDRDLSMVFQNFALYPLKDVYGNLAFPLRMRKMLKAEIDRRVKETAALLGLTDLLARKPRELSGGQQQRVALGRAIVRSPKAFLMDEPLSNLDAKLRVQMRAEIKRMQRTLGVTVIYVTHDQVEAMTMSDRLVVMNQGQVQQVGTPQEVFRNPVNQFVAGFIGSPSINLFPARLLSAADTLVLSMDGGTLPVPEWAAQQLRQRGSEAVTVGFRPSAISISASERPGAQRCALYDIEPTGEETYVYITLGGRLLVSRMDDFPTIPISAPVWAQFAVDGLHLFHPGTGQSLLDRSLAPAGEGEVRQTSGPRSS